MEDPKTVILSSIESLDRWLLKKADRWEHSYEKLANLVVGMADFGEEYKESVLSFMAGMADSWEESKGLSWWNDPWVDSKEEMFKLVIGAIDLGEESRKEKMYGLVAGMAEFWERNNNRERLCSLLLRMAYRSFEETEVVLISNGNMVKLVVEIIADIWGVDKEKLHNLLAPVVVNWDHYARKIYEEKMINLVMEMGGINHMWKLNEEKLYTWLASKVGLLTNEQKLFGLLLDIARYQDDSADIDELTRKNVEGARIELRLILDFITGIKLEDQAMHYFVYDAVEMANDAHCLIQLKDSDPFILLHQMFILQDHNCISRDASKFSKKMMLINKWLQETKERILEFRVEKAIAGPQHDVGEGSKYLVGVEEDIDLLLHLEDFGTITFIKGMIGSGKTTLAAEVYNRATVDDRFGRCAWVCMSRKFSRKEILMSLLLQVVEVDKRDGSFEKMDNKRLIHMVRQHLEGMRYFIVFDDVCEETYVKYVVKAFPQVKGSRFLFTTCNTSIRIDHCSDYNHHMRFLGDDESWQLLLNTLLCFGVVDQKSLKKLMKKGIEILKKCNGLPLAIKEVGRQCANKRQSGIEWEEILNEAPTLGETLMALESTYNNFDAKLKSCFLHLAFFKEGITIKAERLARILSAGRLELERWELNSLSDESIIQVMDKDSSNVVKTCRINAVFHKLSIIKSQQELGSEILRKDGNHRPSQEARHRVIYSGREEFISSSSMNQDKYLVSLFLYGGGYFDASSSYWEQFEQLNILDMEDFGLKILPDAVGSLSELRYLGLRNNYIQELPRSLARLKKLEVLDIALNFMVVVPDIIWDMDSLSHVYLSDIVCEKPLRIGALEKLETLSFVPIDSWTYGVSDLMKKTSLFRLGIEEIDEGSDARRLFVSLAEMEELRCLILRGFRFRSMPSSLDEVGILEGLHVLKLEGRLEKLPKANDFPRELRQLSLLNSSLDEDPMPVLENLVNLEYLKLQNAYTGRQMVISPNRFPELDRLVIGGLWHLRNIQVAESALWRLQQLEIYSCPYLEILPEEILSIKSLERLKIVTTKSIATKFRESCFLSGISEVDIQP